MKDMLSEEGQELANELHRLDATRRYKAFAGIWKQELYDLVFLASQICDTPIALLTLVDEDKQWFITAHGTDITSTERQIAFCNKTIQHNDILSVPDALADSSFVNNPLVTDEPNVRFYAGAPLTTGEGYAIGSLCVLDKKPKQLSAQQLKSLQALSRQAIRLMDLTISRQALTESQEGMAESEIKLRSILDTSDSYQILVGRNMEILAFNKAADDFIKFALGKGFVLGDNVINYSAPASISSLISSFNRALSGERVYGERNLHYSNVIDTWWDVVYSPARNSKGEIMGVSFNAADITNRKRNEQQLLVQNEKLKEIAQIQSHQVRGPLTSILGILNLIKEDGYMASREYLVLLEKAAIQMDENIRRIVAVNKQTGS